MMNVSNPKKRCPCPHEVDMLSAKMNLLMKKMEEGSKKEQEVIQPYTIAQAIEADSWCEVCVEEMIIQEIMVLQ